MSWHYQIIRKKTASRDSNFNSRAFMLPAYFNVHEVYKLEGTTIWSSEPINLANFESVKEIRATLKMIAKDLKHYPAVKIIGNKLVKIGGK